MLSLIDINHFAVSIICNLHWRYVLLVTETLCKQGLHQKPGIRVLKAGRRVRDQHEHTLVSLSAGPFSIKDWMLHFEKENKHKPNAVAPDFCFLLKRVPSAIDFFPMMPPVKAMQVNKS